MIQGLGNQERLLIVLLFLLLLSSMLIAAGLGQRFSIIVASNKCIPKMYKILLIIV